MKEFLKEFVDTLSVENVEILKSLAESRINQLKYEKTKEIQSACDCRNHGFHEATWWRYLYKGRHGSDKGNSYYECRHCKRQDDDG